jgi:hypothetical protein
MALGLALFVVPTALLRWSMRRRPWGLRLLLTLPVIAAVVLATYRLSRTYLIVNPFFTTARSLYELAAGAVLGVCFIAFFRQLALSASRRRWWKLGIILGIPLAHIAIGLSLALVWLDPSLRYQWDKWCSLPIAAVGNMGILIVCWTVLRAVGSSLWRGVRRTSVLVRPTRSTEAELTLR